MSELDPLCGYTEETTPTYNHYNRMKKNLASRRNCKLATFSVVLVATSLIVATVFLFVVDNDSADDGPLPTDVTPLDLNVEHSLLQVSFPIKKGRSREFKGKDMASWETPTPTVDMDLLKECNTEGRNEVNRRKAMEKTLVEPKGPAFYHQMSTALNEESVDWIQSGVMAEATLRCLKDHQIELETLQKSGWRFLQEQWPQCGEGHSPFGGFKCSAKDKYRWMDGICNNLQHPQWGSALQPFRRMLPAEYEDGFSKPKPSFPTGIHPPGRQVSICMQNATNQYDEPRLSMLFVHFAHFLDHDFSNIAAYKGANRSAIPCCGAEERHPECFALELKSNDPFYKEKGLMCMDFVRSAPAPQCHIGVREQMNQASSYIDLSNVYSTTEKDEHELRDVDGGYMKSPTEPDGRYMLLRSKDLNDGCNRPDMLEANTPCFRSGDLRVNEFIGLTNMNQIWMREHNRVTDFFIKINGHWSDERLYQESRRVVIAEMQHVVYNEFVPLLLGEKLTKSLGLNPLKEGYFHGYDDNLDAGVANSFASAAFRFYHSMIKDLVAFEQAGSGVTEFAPLHTMLYNPFSMWQYGKVDELIRGSAAQNPRPIHTSFAAEVANHLFQQENASFGFDLFAFNIQRGRDHGLPPYYKWREVCHLPPAANFTQMKEFFRPHSLELIQRFYVDATHLDLFTGMLAENPLPDGLLGPTASCIIADQFVRAKRGDRFWYETDDPLLRFTPDQLSSIRDVTLARVLCENGDAMDTIQERALEAVSESNPRKHCSGYQIPRLDLTRWHEAKPEASFSKH
ncbi:peroxidasin homolog [Daphnia carinata]|uniref:peroxidasin homolog n=1 Tax=Daphnia carinata TaxID=120202 RepID=UPI00257ECC8E|nr:peroxidasin homolog [Daphnia carinata]